MIDMQGQISCDNCLRHIATVQADPKVVVVAFRPLDVTNAVQNAGGEQVRYNGGFLEFDSACVVNRAGDTQ